MLVTPDYAWKKKKKKTIIYSETVGISKNTVMYIFDHTAYSTMRQEENHEHFFIAD